MNPANQESTTPARQADTAANLPAVEVASPAPAAGQFAWLADCSDAEVLEFARQLQSAIKA